MLSAGVSSTEQVLAVVLQKRLCLPWPMLADVYLRISDDPEGLEVGVDRQQEDCLAKAAAVGATVRTVWRENDRGASMFSRKPRPKYEAMVKAVEGRETECIITYSNSRLTRRPAELEDWIRLHESTGVQIITCVSGTDDLSTADGRMVARIKASVDAAEAERISERVARAHKASRQKGEPGGGPRPFGFEQDRKTPHPIEAPLVKEAVTHLLTGGSLTDIVLKWNANGILTTRGNQWSTSTLSHMLKNPRLKGMRGKWVNEKGKRGHWEVAVDSAGNEVKGQWEAIVPPEQFDAIQRLFNGRRRVSGSSKYLLTPFLRCGNCGSKMRAYRSPSTKGGVVYSCQPKSNGGCGKVSRAAYRVDSIVLPSILRGLDAVLSDVQAVPVSLDLDDDFRRLESNLADALQAWKRGDLPSEDYFTLRRELTEDRKALEERRLKQEEAKERATSKVNALKRWDKATMAERQSIIDAMVVAVIIDPLPVIDGKRVSKWNPELVRVVWRS